jgi:hypothetical protein
MNLFMAKNVYRKTAAVLRECVFAKAHHGPTGTNNIDTSANVCYEFVHGQNRFEKTATVQGSVICKIAP